MNARHAAIQLTFASSLLLALAIALPTVAQNPAGAPVKLGKVSFPVSCNPAAQKEFEVAMAYYHSFAWPENKAALDRVLKILPALQTPTISSLSDPNWTDVNTIIDEAVVRDIVPKLKEAGASGIVEYPLNKIID